MKGWRTILFNLAVAAVLVAEEAEAFNLGDGGAELLAVLGVAGNLVLRGMTTTPVGRAAIAVPLVFLVGCSFPVPLVPEKATYVAIGQLPQSEQVQSTSAGNYGITIQSGTPQSPSLVVGAQIVKQTTVPCFTDGDGANARTFCPSVMLGTQIDANTGAKLGNYIQVEEMADADTGGP